MSENSYKGILRNIKNYHLHQMKAVFKMWANSIFVNFEIQSVK